MPKWAQPLVIPPEMPETTPSYYEIAVRQFEQQILPAPMPKTTLWSYGSINHPETFNYPAFTIETHVGVPTRVKWINDLVDASGNYLPHLLPVDQTLHWANPPGGETGRDMEGASQEPYMGPVPIVTHVHGAHVTPESDGYPEAWYLPDANNIPAGYATRGTFWDQIAGVADEPGAATFQYSNDQPATTLWYHDHALGITRLNVYAGPAGFYLLRGGSNDLSPGVLPGPAPKVGDAPGTKYYEIPIVIQGRSFNSDGSLFYPDHRAFFEGLEPERLLIPFRWDPAIGGPSDVAKIWNPEFFANVMVANGKAWPYLEVEPRRYRLRLLNGCNSRFLILRNHDGLPFWVIGTDQGFLGQPDQREQLLIGPSERYDVIVDFSAYQPGDTIIMENIGPDEPFGGGEPGQDFLESDPETSGDVMQFKVVPLTGPDTSSPPDQLVLPTEAPLGSADNTRKLSLNELDSETVLVVEDEDDTIALDSEGEPFGPMMAPLGTLNADGTPNPLLWSDQITEKPRLNDTEIWELHNFTVDAHPIHLHLVRFEVIEREDEQGAITPPEPWETGYKDTVIAYPGQITRVKAKFDIAGLCVWHCHILEHEDNEMMRPYEVVAPLKNVNFPDVLPGYRFFDAATYLAAHGIIEGYQNGLFGPYDCVRRAQMAKIAVLALGHHDTATTNLGDPIFPDVEYTGQPYPFDFVEEAAEQEIVLGYTSGLFGPYDNITRIQMVRMVARAAGDRLEQPPANYESGFTDIDPADEVVLAIAKYNGLIEGKTASMFDPYACATRGHVAQVLYQAMQLPEPMLHQMVPSELGPASDESYNLRRRQGS